MNKAYFSIGVDMLSRRIAGLDFQFLMTQMGEILDITTEDMKIESCNRRGYLTLMDGITGEIILTVPFGEIPVEKREKYLRLSQEKAQRLFTQITINLPSGTTHHTSSFQSRNEEKEQYGGAIYCNFHSFSIILSFSGTPELADEAMMLVLGGKIQKYLHGHLLTNIEACDRNPYFNELLIRCS